MVDPRINRVLSANNLTRPSARTIAPRPKLNTKMALCLGAGQNTDPSISVDKGIRMAIGGTAEQHDLSFLCIDLGGRCSTGGEEGIFSRMGKG